MCRIVGIADYKKTLGENLERVTLAMRDSMAHGGPDDAGIYINEDRNLAFGHRRLSVIDTSSLGHQPMGSVDRKIWITYNGEIYNFQELRNELVSSGYSFRSKTDTEVLIYGYEKWGIEGLLSRLRGMFAFVIYDARKPGINLILARDRFGIKPLYYYFNKDKKMFIFASEVKAFLKSKLVPDEKNLEALVNFLKLGSIPVPLTTIKNVFSILAGHYMVVNEEGMKLIKYWDLPLIANINNSFSEGECASTTRDLLIESVKLHLISDVALGVFLSGGVDSSAIVALASKFQSAPLNTLSVIFKEEEYNEEKYSRLISQRFKTNHHEILLGSNDFLNEIPKILAAMDQPTIDGINTYFISKVAKKSGLKVVLSGIGGDEVFLGYKHYKKTFYLQKLITLLKLLPSQVRKNLIDISINGANFVLNKKSFGRIAYLNEPEVKNAYLVFRGLFAPQEINDLLGIPERESEPLTNNTQLPESLVESFDILDFKHYLQDQILKDTDFMSMAHSIELRVPFLDHKLFEYVFSLPSQVKLQNGINKSLLVHALGSDLPEEIWNRPKKGFVFPFCDWIKKERLSLEEQCLNNDLLDKKAQKKVWKDFKRGKAHWSRVWSLVVLSELSKNEFQKKEELILCKKP